MGLSAIVEVDEKGRILIPAEVRKHLHSKRFKVTTSRDRIELEPLPAPEDLRGKYRKVIRREWEELEEMGEKYVENGRR